ncbi:MAG TPA: GNAT family N-acetyltransferase [Bacteroidia bacterium]|nr:GNAT family N-acetyltransferase [Bacteroidia bacterium]
MKILPLELKDLEEIKRLQPEDWYDITPFVEYYTKAPFSNVVKVVEGGKIAGTGTVIYHYDTVWLALIIVHPEFRNRGLGRHITEYLIKSLDGSRYKTIYLVATPMGEPIYTKLGFEIENEQLFFKGDIINNSIIENIYPYEEKYKSSLLELDCITYGENREARLAEHLPAGQLYIRNNTLEGFYLPDLGEGLIVAANSTAGTELMKERLKTKPFAVTTVENKPAVEFLLNNNFTNFRNARRMRLGEARSWKPDNIYNRVNGQLG